MEKVREEKRILRGRRDDQGKDKGNEDTLLLLEIRKMDWHEIFVKVYASISKIRSITQNSTKMHVIAI